MATLDEGQRVRIIALGPKDSWNRDGDEYNLIGQEGTLVYSYGNQFATEGFESALIELDKPLLNYLVRINLLEAKFERIESDGDS